MLKVTDNIKQVSRLVHEYKTFKRLFTIQDVFIFFSSCLYF